LLSEFELILIAYVEPVHVTRVEREGLTVLNCEPLTHARPSILEVNLVHRDREVTCVLNKKHPLMVRLHLNLPLLVLIVDLLDVLLVVCCLQDAVNQHGVMVLYKVEVLVEQLVVGVLSVIKLGIHRDENIILGNMEGYDTRVLFDILAHVAQAVPVVGANQHLAMARVCPLSLTMPKDVPQYPLSNKGLILFARLLQIGILRLLIPTLLI
jgi:hypothetical protein